jgi:DNA-directed RNA polymerase specialized sigma24 family protein
VHNAAETKAGLTAALAEDRAWLVRLCARLAGNGAVAEDLAQEVLFDAWRNAHKLTDPSGHRRWLAAIAQNVYLRWRSSRGRHAAREVRVDNGQPTGADLPCGTYFRGLWPPSGASCS